ncbi:hypothetical protein JH06_1280 [Blastocystis sp. subtype 4]|uniref:hypothetical protein n=1 Tax=Blastocystis sp. subtype 4 TaxID=944170 RepID=UPI00071160D8|nr:hypothetical protein JH06_1280 [Blastocystis sp. subtype 4]KNB45008.1 hypothetical protein JH06_1280 [Blastocystis sp. subtype 4]|eukprot:XP_014528451.1 hypothetical protein JH06_1280 [Blastocystis sp. subtype 4]
MYSPFYFGRIAEPVNDLKEYLDIVILLISGNALGSSRLINEFSVVEREPQGCESSILLDVKTWTHRIVGKLSSSIRLDDPNEQECLRSEDQFREELEWAYYLGVPSVFCMELTETNDNYAAILNEFIERKYTTPVPARS